MSHWLKDYLFFLSKSVDEFLTIKSSRIARAHFIKTQKIHFQDILINSQVQIVSTTKQTGRILAGNTKFYDISTRDEPKLL